MLSAGEVIGGKYRVDRVLGQGGMGCVVAATHLELGERRAIKLMLPVGFDSEEARERFRREARATASLRSPHVVTVHDVGELASGTRYIVMEYLEGQDLGAVMRERKILPAAEAIGYMLDVCDALSEAHAKGMVHRDLKPANLFRTIGHNNEHLVKVVDFGIAKVRSAEDEATASPLTEMAAVMGSPPFMSPEQIKASRNVDARSDLWSLGVVLYYFVTGHRPFNGEMPMILLSILSDEPKPPNEINPDIPRALSEVILRCLRKNPLERYASASALADALHSIGKLSAELRTASGAAGRETLPPARNLGLVATETDLGRANQYRSPMQVSEATISDNVTLKKTPEDEPLTVRRETDPSDARGSARVSQEDVSPASTGLEPKKAAPRPRVSRPAVALIGIVTSTSVVVLLALLFRASTASEADIPPSATLASSAAVAPPPTPKLSETGDLPRTEVAPAQSAVGTPSASMSAGQQPARPSVVPRAPTPALKLSSARSEEVHSPPPGATVELKTPSAQPAPSDSTGGENKDDWKKKQIH